MTPDFSAEFHSRIEALVSDLRYYNKTDDTRIAPRVYKTMFPSIEEFVVGHNGQDINYAPAICWGIDSGEVARIDRHPFNVSLLGLVAVDQGDGDSLSQIQAGSADIEELAVALKGLIRDCHYAGFKLNRPVLFSFGLPGTEGDRIQPHPIYIVRYSMSFIAT